MEHAKVRKKNRWVSRGAWVLVLVALPASLAWTLGSSVFFLDQIASMQAQIAVLLLAVSLIVLCLRRWSAAAVLLVLVGIATYPVVVGRHVSLPSVQYDSKPDGVLRVVSCNLRPENELWEQAMQSLMDLDADLIIIQEVPPELSRGVRLRGWLEGKSYPFYEIRGAVPGVVSTGMILCRYPLERVWPGLGPDVEQHVLLARIEHPTGSFLAGQFHPRSPRSSEHWRAGNEAIEKQLNALDLLRPEIAVIGADLNSAPAQHRARMVRASGLRISKPLTRLGGSYPADRGVPEMLTIEIDGVWTRGARVIAWDRIRVLGSDHRAIVTDLRLGASSPDS